MDRSQACRNIARAGHTGDRGVVEAGLAAADAGARALAIGAAVRLDVVDVQRLIGFLADDSLDVRYRVLEVLPKVTNCADATDAVIAQMAEPELAELAAFTLGEIDPHGNARIRAVDALRRQATDHGDALCRESAVAALGALGAGLDAILAACNDIATVRRRAVLALAPFDGADVDAALARAVEDRDWQVRQAAEDLLSVDTAAESAD